MEGKEDKEIWETAVDRERKGKKPHKRITRKGRGKHRKEKLKS